MLQVAPRRLRGPDRELNSTVEYAMEAISHAGTVLAVLSKEGIAMASEKVSSTYPTLAKT